MIVFFQYCQGFLKINIEFVTQCIQTFGRFSVGFCYVGNTTHIIFSSAFNSFCQQMEVFSFHKWLGLNTRPFTIVKFKTMRDAFDDKGAPLPDEVRIKKLVDLFDQHH